MESQNVLPGGYRVDGCTYSVLDAGASHALANAYSMFDMSIQ